MDLRRYLRKPSTHPGGTCAIQGADFPLNARLAQYAVNLLQINKNPGDKLVELTFSLLPPESAWALFDQMTARGSCKKSLERLREDIEEATDSDDLTRAFYRFFSKPGMKLERVIFRECLAAWLEKSTGSERNSYRARIDQLCQKINLTAEEVSVLELGCCYQLCDELEGLLDDYNIMNKAGIIALMTGLPASRVRQIISSKGKLVQSDFLTTVDNNHFDVNDTIFNFLIGVAGKDFAAEAFKSASSAGVSFGNFDLKPVQREALVRMVNAPNPFNILFYGKPGTGKTELSKALASHCGTQAVFVNYGDDGDGRDRKTALIATVNSVPRDTLVIVDEVDGLLNTQRLFGEPRVNKGWINHFLDTSQHKIIWICNEISGIEESVRRRFAYSLLFKQLTWQQRDTIWMAQLRKHRIKRFFQNPEVQQLAKRFPVSPGLIAYAARTISKCRSDEMTAPAIHAMLEEVLTRQMELTEGVKPEKKLNNINENYDPEALNTDMNTGQLLQGLEKFQAAETDYGMNLLFWGWPGTGKTEFGKHIAGQLGKELLVKRMSDLQSMYVGETEKQIARAFQEAEENDAILFLDEADSLFINRQTANRSWEISQTNEILTQMENFPGILICCTNLLDHLDEAAMRRFAFKIKFLPLTDEGKLRLYRKYFSATKGSLSPALEARLYRIRNLCPGDIKAVWQRTQFMGATLSHQDVVSELEKEVGYKKGTSTPIGFVP